MKLFFVFVLMAGLFSCDNATTAGTELDSAKQKLDTFVDRVENSKVVDSIKSKGGVILDSVKSKGGRLIDRAGDEIDGKSKDSAKMKNL